MSNKTKNKLISMWTRRVLNVPKEQTITKSGILEINYPAHIHLISVIQNCEEIFRSSLHPRAQNEFASEHGVNFDFEFNTFQHLI